MFGRLKDVALIIINAEIISRTLVTLNPATKITPLANKNNPNIRTNPVNDVKSKIPKIQNINPTIISNAPNIFNIIVFLNYFSLLKLIIAFVAQLDRVPLS